MRRRPLARFLPPLAPAAAALAASAVPAHAQAPTYDFSWAKLDPGDDWSAKIILSVFPVGATPGAADSTGAAATVIGALVGQLTAFVAAAAMAFVAYGLIMQLFRGAETARLLDRNMTAMFLVRMGVAAILMYPLPSGFSAGQFMTVRTALWGAGMAKTFYDLAVQAVGPDSMVVAQPIIPGTKTIVAGLIQNEFCRASINAATGQANMAPEPSPITNAGYVTWSYSLSAGNATGAPACGTVTLRTPNAGATNIAGVGVDMTAEQKRILTEVLEGGIRPAVAAVAQRFWQTKQASALVPLQGVLQSATAMYTARLTAAATAKTRELRNALSATEARNGNVGLLRNQEQLRALGWTSAGAYYLEFARLNGQTMTLMSATPVVNLPSWEGLGRGLSRDLAPLATSVTAFMTKLMTYVQTTDGLDAPGGNANLFMGATPGEDGAGVMEQLFRSLRLDDRLLNAFTDDMSPTGNRWTDPFGALMQLGNKMAAISLAALGAAALLNSATGTAAAAVWNVLSGNPAGAGATVVGHFVVSFLATPIFTGLMAILVPALAIAFVLPMIPWLMFLAGVIGWLVLVCEAVIAVPLWMLAHMTFQGEGLHGRAEEGYSLLFSVLFRPTLMVFGLFLGYFVFAATSWLIRASFGIAAGFVLANGWVVVSVIGVAVLLCIFVLVHTVAALLSFRMIALVPHHLPKLVGFASANRVDMDDFSRDAALVGAAGALRTIGSSVAPRGMDRGRRLPYVPRPALSGPEKEPKAGNANGNGGMDTTLRAATDVPPQPPPREEA